MRGVRGQHIESAICSSTCTARLNHRIVASDRSCGRRADGSVQSLASECALSDYPWSSLSFHDKRTSIRWHIQRIALASYGRANECQSVLHVSIGYGFSPFHHSSSASITIVVLASCSCLWCSSKIPGSISSSRQTRSPPEV